MKSIKLFGLALAGNNFDYKTLLETALKVGYIVDSKCSTNEVYKFLQNEKINLNSTFYKTWNDVVSKDRFELLLDQIEHYASTYGTNFTEDAVVKNENFDKIDETVNFSSYKVIKSATQEEIIEKCNGLLASGIALSDETINDLFEIYERFNYLPDINLVKNKEAKMKICLQKGLLPTDPVEMVRFLVFVMTETTLLIKNKQMLTILKNTKKDISSYVNKFGIEKLSQVFLRYKDLFLAMKHSHKNNAAIVNKLRKLAIKNHKPYNGTFFENLLSEDITFEKLETLSEKIKELNNFKKVSLIETLRKKINNDLDVNTFVIRNGKFFINEISQDEKEKNSKNKSIYELLERIIYDDLVENIKAKYEGKTFFIPEMIDIKVPRSEKTFIGNYPMGSEIKLPEKDLIIGINWRGEDGTQDFDLSFTDFHGNRIGWNAGYYDERQEVIYSGDVTSARPEATELMYFKNNSKEGLLKINRFNGNENSLFTLFVASDNSKICKNTMVKKENVVFQAKLINDKAEQILGFKADNSFVLQKIISGNKRVSTGNSVSTDYIEFSRKNQKNLLSFEKLLIDAGLTKSDNNENVNFDYSNLAKDDIISMLTK